MVLATKKSIKQLESLFNVLGEYGGTITTFNPDIWWELDLEVESIKEKIKRISIGVASTINADTIFDPVFTIELMQDNDNKIKEAVIVAYESSSVMGTLYSGEDDVLHGFGMKEKANMRMRFSCFMKNITEIGPYLSNPREIKKYTKTLEDY